MYGTSADGMPAVMFPTRVKAVWSPPSYTPYATMVALITTTALDARKEYSQNAYILCLFELTRANDPENLLARRRGGGILVLQHLSME